MITSSGGGAPRVSWWKKKYFLILRNLSWVNLGQFSLVHFAPKNLNNFAARGKTLQTPFLSSKTNSFFLVVTPMFIPSLGPSSLILNGMEYSLVWVSINHAPTYINCQTWLHTFIFVIWLYREVVYGTRIDPVQNISCALHSCICGGSDGSHCERWGLLKTGTSGQGENYFKSFTRARALMHHHTVHFQIHSL